MPSLDKLCALLKRFEGNVPFMYLDTRGNVTVGVGHLLASQQAALGLPFLLPYGIAADELEIMHDYRLIKEALPGRLPSYYAQIADLRMSQESVDKLLVSDIVGVVAGFGAHPILKYPDGPYMAFVNMAFQLGVRGVIEKYPRLMAAAAAHNWPRCAAECTINGAQAERNEANRQLFLAA